MTPAPTSSELAARHTFDPAPGTVHIHDLIAMAKDGVYAKDKLSDHVIGMLVLAKDTKVVSTWEGTLFQVPFVKGMKIRASAEHLGHPFTDPDGNVLILGGRTLHGSSDIGIQLSALTAANLKDHPQYSTWLLSTLYAGRAQDATTYVRVRNNHTLKTCDAYVNSIPYTPGPMSVPPATSHPSGSGSVPSPAMKKKKKASTGKKTAASTATADPSTPTPAGKKHKSKKPATKLRVKKKSGAEAAWAAAEDILESGGKGEGTSGDYASESETSPLSNPPASEGEGGTHPQYGGKTLPSPSTFMAINAQFTAAENAGESGGEESRGEESGGEDYGGEDYGGEDYGGEDYGGEESGGKESGGEESGGEYYAAEEPADEDRWYVAKEPADEEPADEEPADEEPADEEPADEEPAAEFVVEEPLPAADDQGSDDDYDPTPTKKRKTGKRGGKKGRGKGGKK
jgi:hypothetical protein